MKHFIIGPKMTVVPLAEAHYPAVYKIYKDGIATGIATLETERVRNKSVGCVRGVVA